MIFVGLIFMLFGFTLAYVSVDGKYWQAPWKQILAWAKPSAV